MSYYKLVIAGALFGLILAGCKTTDDTPPPPQSGIGANLPTPITPPDARVADLLQEAKQQYDDRQHLASLRLAQQAEQLIRENQLPIDSQATAINIQGYCLLQLGRLDDYAVKNFGRQQGAATKFLAAQKLTPDAYPNNFRSQLGLALVRFRRHGESIRKAESIDQGLLALAQIKEGLKRSLAGGADAAQRKRDVVRKCTMFTNSRTRLIELGYVFQDPNSVVMDDKGDRPDAPWLGGMTQAEEELALFDVRLLLEDTVAGTAIEDVDRDRAMSAADRMIESWRKVRKYWRLEALKDLQGARDEFLKITKMWPGYFWAERDLTFIYQSLGGFFLDVGLEQARLQAIAAGVQDDMLEDEARRIYVSKDFKPWEKEQSRINYVVALEYTMKFVQSHQGFERLRDEKKRAANYDDMNENPFLVDLVQRYHQAMDDLIAEERGMRASMMLEAAALCVDPVFQINDIEQAINLAHSVHALEPNNPIHHFVRATAYYTDRQFDKALASYTAFLKESSITTDARQRDISRKRKVECEEELRRNPPTGGAGSDR